MHCRGIIKPSAARTGIILGSIFQDFVVNSLRKIYCDLPPLPLSCSHLPPSGTHPRTPSPPAAAEPLAWRPASGGFLSHWRASPSPPVPRCSAGLRWYFGEDASWGDIGFNSHVPPQPAKSGSFLAAGASWKAFTCGRVGWGRGY